MNSGVKRIISAKNDLIKYRGSLIQRITDCSNILTSIDFQIRFKFYQL